MNLYSNTLFIDLQNYRPLHAMWDSSIQQRVAGLYVLNFSTLTHSFVFKDFLLWLSGENGSFEVINRIIIQYYRRLSANSGRG